MFFWRGLSCQRWLVVWVKAWRLTLPLLSKVNSVSLSLFFKALLGWSLEPSVDLIGPDEVRYAPSFVSRSGSHLRTSYRISTPTKLRGRVSS
jgi:hypothetical protein